LKLAYQLINKLSLKTQGIAKHQFAGSRTEGQNPPQGAYNIDPGKKLGIGTFIGHRFNAHYCPTDTTSATSLIQVSKSHLGTYILRGGGEKPKNWYPGPIESYSSPQLIQTLKWNRYRSVVFAVLFLILILPPSIVLPKSHASEKTFAKWFLLPNFGRILWGVAEERKGAEDDDDEGTNKKKTAGERSNKKKKNKATAKRARGEDAARMSEKWRSVSSHDLLKAYGVIAMIMDHAAKVFGPYENAVEWTVPSQVGGVSGFYFLAGANLRVSTFNTGFRRLLTAVLVMETALKMQHISQETLLSIAIIRAFVVLVVAPYLRNIDRREGGKTEGGMAKERLPRWLGGGGTRIWKHLAVFGMLLLPHFVFGPYGSLLLGYGSASLCFGMAGVLTALSHVASSDEQQQLTQQPLKNNDSSTIQRKEGEGRKGPGLRRRRQRGGKSTDDCDNKDDDDDEKCGGDGTHNNINDNNKAADEGRRGESRESTEFKTAAYFWLCGGAILQIQMFWANTAKRLLDDGTNSSQAVTIGGLCSFAILMACMATYRYIKIDVRSWYAAVLIRFLSKASFAIYVYHLVGFQLALDPERLDLIFAKRFD